MLSWFHKLLNPHCSDCAHENHCNTCDVLQRQLDLCNQEKSQLLNRLLDKDKPEQIIFQDGSIPETPKFNIPWAVKKQMLENESREKAKILRDTIKPDVDKLESEIFEAKVG